MITMKDFSADYCNIDELVVITVLFIEDFHTG